MTLALNQKRFFGNLRPFDWFCLMLGFGALGYYLYTVPYVLLLAGVIFGLLYPFIGIPFISNDGLVIRQVDIKVPYTNYRITIKIWHILTLALTLSWLLLTIGPSDAFFLVTAQEKMQNIICAATSTTSGIGATTGGGSTVTGTTTCSSAGMVTVIFDIIRVVVALAVIGGIVAVIVQGQQQQDVRPAVMFIGIVVGGVLIVEAASRWLLT
ncbi:hypothetical protein [Gloeothece verrucosa]|nr:hypothetical protein [Gloeothece verrucosa]